MYMHKQCKTSFLFGCIPYTPPLPLLSHLYVCVVFILYCVVCMHSSQFVPLSYECNCVRCGYGHMLFILFLNVEI